MPRSIPAPQTTVRKKRGSGELNLIEGIRRRAQAGTRNPALRLGIGDDCAILRPPSGHDIVVTTDMSLEGKHFRRDWHTAEQVGYRTLARGLSDLAAMGAKPLAAFLSLALPRLVDHRWVNSFLDGLFMLAGQQSVPLAGGDTAESPSEHAFADIVLLGSVPSGKALRRSGARPGDFIYCTGALGGAAAGLAGLAANRPKRRGVVSAGKREKHPHLYPQPRLAVGQALVRRGGATACIDVSDGLSTDLMHLCEESGVAAEIDREALPIHALAAALGADGALDSALNGGEDYELLFTAPAHAKMPSAITGVPVTRIGKIVRTSRGRPQMSLIQQGKSRVLQPRGWEHLR